MIEKLLRHELALLMRANAEALFVAITGSGPTRAYNPACPPKRCTPKKPRGTLNNKGK
jgi:hypothetical protein